MNPKNLHPLFSRISKHVWQVLSVFGKRCIEHVKALKVFLRHNPARILFFKRHIVSMISLCLAVSLVAHKRASYESHMLTDACYEEEGDQDTDETPPLQDDEMQEGGDESLKGGDVRSSTPPRPDTSIRAVAVVSDKPTEHTLTVGRGDTLNSILVSYGVSSSQAHQLITALNPVYSARRLQVGQSLKVNMHRDVKTGQVIVNHLALHASVYQDVFVTRNGDKFTAKKSTIELDKSLMSTAGRIKGTFFRSAVSLGAPTSIAKKAMQALSSEVNFSTDPKAGNGFAMVYEVFKDKKGTIVKYGNLLYAAIAIQGKVKRVYFFDGPHGPNYYNANGECTQQGFMRSPLDMSHLKISSGYGMRRHPIRGYDRFHAGIDYRAPSGTRILAAASGVVTKACYWGGFGLYVAIKHGEYSTEYAHMSTIASGIRPGVHVKQGQCIGRVGSTGSSTSPHLHFGLRKNGQHVNPKSVKMLPSHKLDAKDRVKFVAFQKRVEDSIADKNIIKAS